MIGLHLNFLFHQLCLYPSFYVHLEIANQEFCLGNFFSYTNLAFPGRKYHFLLLDLNYILYSRTIQNILDLCNWLNLFTVLEIDVDKLLKKNFARKYQRKKHYCSFLTKKIIHSQFHERKRSKITYKLLLFLIKEYGIYKICLPWLKITLIIIITIGRIRERWTRFFSANYELLEYYYTSLL